MTLNQFQAEAKKTDFLSEFYGDDFRPLLVRLADAARNLREVEIFDRLGKTKSAQYEEHLLRHIGAVLWYVAIVSDQVGLPLQDVATHNLSFGRKSFGMRREFQLYDKQFPIEQKLLPREETYLFFERTQVLSHTVGQERHRIPTIALFRKDAGALVSIGNEVNDNAPSSDGYRFHDVLHMAYAVFLGWSPVMRKLWGRKRRSDAAVDEFQDGARSRDIEESITSYIFRHAQKEHYFRHEESISYHLLYAVKLMAGDLEVSSRTFLHWKSAIREGFGVLRLLMKHKGGEVVLDPRKRTIKFKRLTDGQRKKCLSLLRDNAVRHD